MPEPPKGMACRLVTLSMLIACLLVPANRASALTILLDFRETGYALGNRFFSVEAAPFDPTLYGYTTANEAVLHELVRAGVERAVHGIPTQAESPLSPIPAGMELDVDILLGHHRTPPANGDDDYFFISAAEEITGPGYRGNTWSRVRPLGFFRGAHVAGVYTNRIETVDELTFVFNHELGHVLGLDHGTGPTLSGLPDYMGGGGIGWLREYSISDVHKLVDHVGLRPIPEPSTGVLLLVGLTALPGIARRQRRATGRGDARR